MNKQLLTGAITASTVAIALFPTSAQAFNLANGTYKLYNHPDGNAADPGYGLRLDELININQNKKDIFTFDFNDSVSNMQMTIQDSEIRIFGHAFGGLDIGDTYDTNKSGLWNIDFTYENVVDNNDGFVVNKPNSGKLGSNRGTITQLDEHGNSIKVYDLADYSGRHNYTFKLGYGHRGEEGISGWGWLNHAPENDPNKINTHYAASDWLFTAKPVPTPAILPGLIGMGIASIRKKKNQLKENS